MAEANDDGGSLHIAVFPWLAFGHMLPFLALSKSLAQKGHRVSFLSTPRNIQRLPRHSIFLPHPFRPPPPPSRCRPAGKRLRHLRPTPNPHPPPHQISRLSPIPPRLFPRRRVPRLDHPRLRQPLGFPCRRRLRSPLHLLQHLPRSLPRLPRPRRRVEPRHDLAEIRQRLHLSAAVAAARLQSRIPPPRGPVGIQRLRPNVSGVSTIHRLMKALQDSRAVAVRSCRELEADCLRLLPDLYSKPVIPVGLLPPSATAGDEKDEILEWLDRRAAASLLYIAFGSEVELSAEQLQRLALGVELSGVAFLWAMRKGAEELPEGFLECTSGRGVVNRGWVDQIGVLSRAAVGGFLSHCGPSSVVEGIRFGRPLVLFPVFADQGIIARVMVGNWVGAEVERREEDGSF